MSQLTVYIFISAVFLSSRSATADFVEYTDKEKWENAANNDFTTLDFVFEDVEFEVVTDQYADQGVIFPDGNDIAVQGNSFLNDGWGLQGSVYSCGFFDINCEIEVLFDTPQQWIAADYPGGVEFILFMDDTFLYHSQDDKTNFPGSGTGNFAGIVSSVPFNRVIIFDPPTLGDVVFIDNLHFGSPIPAPATLLPLLGGLAFRSRRRTSV